MYMYEFTKAELDSLHTLALIPTQKITHSIDHLSI